jgi:hypothetical protein
VKLLVVPLAKGKREPGNMIPAPGVVVFYVFVGTTNYADGLRRLE